MEREPVRIAPASDRALLVVFDDAITDAGGRAVRALAAWLASEPPEGVVDWQPAYGSVLVEADPSRTSLDRLEATLRGMIVRLAEHPPPPGRSFTIPVRYGGDDGPDLDPLSRLLARSPAEIVALHSEPLYEVRFLGFAPGFPYLAGLPAELATPRRDSPRRRVPAGSVAIAGAQAGIYPSELPGGWNLIGRTETPLFDPRRDPPALLAPGDRVRFVVDRPAP